MLKYLINKIRKNIQIFGIIFLIVQGVSELFKSYWAAKKGEWPGDSK